MTKLSFETREQDRRKREARSQTAGGPAKRRFIWHTDYDLNFLSTSHFLILISNAMHNPEDRSFIGHPRGLGYIAFAEAWERFSYYGMQALLVLYMINRLLLSGHVEHIAGNLEKMPPKSTYFYPKLLSGLVLNSLKGS